MDDGDLFLVRHAKAGNRDRWDGPDHLRPLSPNGWTQAAAIGRRLADAHPTALLSSPYVRCRQTMEPLATTTGHAVVDDARLAEGASFAAVVELLAGLAPGAVLCSHGDVVPDTIAALERRGCQIGSPADWRKGTVWTIRREAGAFSHATVWAPPPT